MSGEARIPCVALIRRVNPHPDTPSLFERGREQCSNLGQRIEVDAKTRTPAIRQPRVLRDAVDEQVVDVGAGIDEAAELTLADDLHSATCAKPRRSECCQWMRFE